MSEKIKKDWLIFEKSVKKFLDALDSKAKVIHDKKTIDNDTKELRQRDVWIESSVCGIPIKILVSCKYLNKKLNVSHIGTFVEEINSSEADKGVIYSKSGFSKNAFMKAKKHKISCCELYQDQPPSIPDVLILSRYLYKTLPSLLVIKKSRDISNWMELFELKIKSNIFLIDRLVEIYEEMEGYALKKENLINRFPRTWYREEKIQDFAGGETVFNLTLGWRFYEADFAGHVVSGSYDFSKNNFTGCQIGPTIDLTGVSLDSGWNLLNEIPVNVKNRLIVGLTRPDFKKSLLETFKNKPISSEKAIKI